MIKDRSSRGLAAGACVVALAAVAGCGSSDGASSAGGADGDADEIVLGSLGPYTGTFSSTYGGVPDVLDAWVETVNAQGGVKGRKVRLVKKDIGTSAGAGGAAARELIEQEEVVAIVANQDAGNAAWAPSAAEKGVPVLSATTETGSYVDPNNFNPQGSAFAVVYGLGQQAKEAGGTLGTVYCAERPTCAQQSQLLQLFVKAQGVDVPVAAKVPASSADFTAYCQQFKSAKVDAVFNSLSTELADRLNSSCAEQGVKATQILSGSLTNLAWKTEPVYEGSVVLDPVAPFFDTSVPGVEEYRKVLDEQAPDVVGTERDNSEALRAWASMELFRAAADKATGELTSESLKEGLYAIKGETLGGIVPPLAFAPDEPALSPCYFRWSPFGEFTALDGGKPTCVPAEQIAPLIEPVLKSLRG